MVLEISWRSFMEEILEENSLASKLKSQIMSRSSLTWAVSEIICKIDRKSVKDTLRNYPLETFSSIVQAKIVILAVSVITKGGESWAHEPLRTKRLYPLQLAGCLWPGTFNWNILSFFSIP